MDTPFEPGELAKLRTVLTEHLEETGRALFEWGRLDDGYPVLVNARSIAAGALVNLAHLDESIRAARVHEDLGRELLGELLGDMQPPRLDAIRRFLLEDDRMAWALSRLHGHPLGPTHKDEADALVLVDELFTPTS